MSKQALSENQPLLLVRRGRELAGFECLLERMADESDDRDEIDAKVYPWLCAGDIRPNKHEGAVYNRDYHKPQNGDGDERNAILECAGELCLTRHN